MEEIGKFNEKINVIANNMEKSDVLILADVFEK